MFILQEKDDDKDSSKDDDNDKNMIIIRVKLSFIDEKTHGIEEKVVIEIIVEV